MKPDHRQTSPFRILPRNLQTRVAKFIVAAVAGILPAPGIAAEAGLMQWSFPYHNTSVPVAVWYPTSETPSQIDAGPFTLSAASNASLPQQPLPLLVISHGTGGSNIAHHPIAEALASAGFLIAALTHPGDNFQDRSLVADERYFDERPKQLIALLNAITSDSRLGTLIDPERIGAIGHSIGGYTVAATIGATPDRQSLIAHCTRADDDPSCDYADPDRAVTSPTDSVFILNDTAESNSQTSPSIKSVVLLAPFGSVIASNSRIDKNVSVRVIAGELDQVLPHRYHHDRIQLAAPHGVFSQAAGAGHFSFIAPVNAAWSKQLAEVAEDPANFDRPQFNASLGQELTDWFTETLKP